LAETVWLDEMDLANMQQGWGEPQVNRSMREQQLSIAGRKFERGVGTHANSSLWIDAGGATRFTASVGVDDAAGGKATVNFRVLADGNEVWESGIMQPGDAAKVVDVPLTGAKFLLLQLTDGGDGVDSDHGNWSQAKFDFTGVKPRSVARPVPQEEAVILTPKPGPAPRINGPKVFAARPGNPFLYRVPTQGERPMEFSAANLPASLRLDAATGIITGVTPLPGQYVVTLQAKNSHGESTRALRIVSGDALSLTPQMGWNHWYTHYDRITDQLVREAADLMVSSGMADVGYQFVNIDDCWMNKEKSHDPNHVGPFRDAAGNILTNKHFPDMKSLTDYIHSKGLRAGIYTSPGPLTCAGFAAAYQHEAADARQFAEWGFDFLKYDWCSYGRIADQDHDPELLKFKKPYQLMGSLLKQQRRDIVFNLCQYGMGRVWEWGAEVGGHSWRTAGDLGFELDRIFEVALANAEHRDFQKPGAWNDPDYIQIGFIGVARGMGEPQPCPLTPTEQYSFMSLWALSSAPLFFSGHMGRLDEFTLNVLCNPEVIDIDQDPLGQCARVLSAGETTFVMVKDLEDGAKAIGLCNAGEFPAEVSATWTDIGVHGKQTLRDVWRQKDLGDFENEYKAQVPRRGVVLLRVTSAK
jgi:alpha-galactosidase